MSWCVCMCVCLLETGGGSDQLERVVASPLPFSSVHMSEDADHANQQQPHQHPIDRSVSEWTTHSLRGLHSLDVLGHARPRLRIQLLPLLLSLLPALRSSHHRLLRGRDT